MNLLCLHCGSNEFYLVYDAADPERPAILCVHHDDHAAEARAAAAAGDDGEESL